MNAGNKLDDLFREAMTGYPVEPSISLWRRIERRFFPPSRFSPSGLITSVILIFIAGLMPWVLIPAKGGEQKEVQARQQGTQRGYILNSRDHNAVAQGKKDRTYSVKTTYFDEPSPLAKHAAGADQGIGAGETAATDEYLLASINTEDIYIPVPSEKATESDYRAVTRYFRMHSQPAGLMNTNYKTGIDALPLEPSVQSTFSARYENDYFRNSEFSAGANFDPSIIFYKTNPNNQMMGADAYARYQVQNWSISGGLGYSNQQDVGSYKINYKTYDSVGYYIRVVSFIPDPRNPGNVVYTTTKETLYDSVPHYTISDKTNHYSYLDFPVSFGYTFFQKGRFSMEANAGITFSVLLAKNEPTVTFTVPNGEFIGIENQVPARMNTNWRFTGGVDFGYLLSDRVSFHFEPEFQQYLSPVYVKQPGIASKKPYIIGLKAGFRYTF